MYLVITIGMTWPLATKMGTEIAWDLGDPVFNCWVLLWTSGQVIATLGGDFNAIHQYWHGNIFSPSRLTIAYSEHLTSQMLQGLPLLSVTGNVVLVYNLLFLSTFVLSGLGMYLLVRDLTNKPAAALLSGVAFAFAPYRISQYSHLQVLSAQWMPFALYGFRRFLVSGRRRPLVGASAALAVQNLSCGYYLLFFSPFVAAYCLFEMAQRGLLRSLRVWRSLTLSALGIGLVTWPFISPYLALRVHGDVGVRSYGEALQFSADVWSFATAADASRLWGGLVAAFRKGEGEGFVGFAVLGFSLIAVVAALRHAGRRLQLSGDRPWQRWSFLVLAAALVIDIAALVAMLVGGSLPIPVEGRPWHDTDPLLIGACALLALLVAITPAARRLLGGAPDSVLGFYVTAAVVAGLLALGPRVQSAGRLLGLGPYYFLYTYIPGFDGVRVPARYFMLVAFFLAVVSGLGAAALLARRPRLGSVLVLAGSLFMLAESWVGPIPTNVNITAHDYALTPRRLERGDAMSPLYRTVRDLRGRVVLIEFPFGEPAYEIMATYAAGFHRRPLVNGYSGFFPETYLRRATFLTGIPFDLDAATRALQSSGATHAIVHEGAFPRGRGHEVTDWLVATGATVTGTYGLDKLLTLAPPKRP
jgi:hypothetical protein